MSGNPVCSDVGPAYCVSTVCRVSGKWQLVKSVRIFRIMAVKIWLYRMAIVTTFCHCV